MRYLVIGLGIYGENLARDLTAMGNEVIGVDCDRTHADAIKDDVTTVYHLDTTEETALAALPLSNVDLVIVAIGENFGASIKTVALLRAAGVKHIYARAIDKLHEAILRGFEIDGILTPEQRAAADLADELELGSAIKTLPVDEDYVVVTLAAPAALVGSVYSELDLGDDVKLIAASRPRNHRNVLGLMRPRPEVLDIAADPELKVEAADSLTLFGTRKKIRDFYRRNR